MWKYVSRRLRDTLERTYNVLETQRTWTCGGNGGGGAEKGPNNHPITTNLSTSSSTINDEDDCQPPFVGRIGPIYADSVQAQQQLNQQQQHNHHQQGQAQPYAAGYTAWVEKWRLAQENLKKDHHFFENAWNERWNNGRNIRGGGGRRRSEDLSTNNNQQGNDEEPGGRIDRRKFKFSKINCPIREHFNKRRFNGEQQTEHHQNQHPHQQNYQQRHHQFRKGNYWHHHHHQQQKKQSICKDEGYSSSSGGDKEDNFKRDQQECNYNCNHKNNYLGAITWSSAIVCGWYTSQILCMKRRRFGDGTVGWHGLSNKLSSASSIRPVHSNLLSHCFLTTPYFYNTEKYNYQYHANNLSVIGINDHHNEKSLSKSKLWFDAAFYDNSNNKNQFYEKDIQKYLYQISNDDFSDILSIGGVNNNGGFGKDNNNTIYINDNSPIKRIKSDGKIENHEVSSQPTTATTTTKTTTTTTVNDAVQELLKVIGDIEYQLGVQSIENEEYGNAVTHFKLGTSHHHMNATFNLGVCYELGLGVKCDLKMAFECYQVASSMGHAKAKYNVAIFHAKGLGGAKKNRRLARQLFVDAARLGQINAHENSVNQKLINDKLSQRSMGSSTIGQPHIIAANKQYGQESSIYIQQQAVV